MTKQSWIRKAGMAAAMLALCGFWTADGLGQEGGPPKLSTNPGNHAIFPQKGQTPEQQEKDQLDAYTWASQKTGWDPYKAHDELVKQGAASGKAGGDTGKSVAKGAAGGAVLGLAVGALADDAGKGAAIGAAAGGLTQGMRSRGAKKGSETAAQSAQEAYKRKFQEWDKFFMAAMEGKGYSVR